MRKGGLTGVPSGAHLNPAGKQDGRRQWEPGAIGPEISQAEMELRSRSAQDVVSSIGVPSALFDPRADGTSRRESYRQLLHGLILPWSKIVEGELSEKLDRKINAQL